MATVTRSCIGCKKPVVSTDGQYRAWCDKCRAEEESRGPLEYTGIEARGMDPIWSGHN